MVSLGCVGEGHISNHQCTYRVSLLWVCFFSCFSFGVLLVARDYVSKKHAQLLVNWLIRPDARSRARPAAFRRPPTENCTRGSSLFRSEFMVR